MKLGILLKQKQNNLLTSLLLVLPLLLLYEIGASFLEVLNGADFITYAVVSLGGYKGYIALQIALVITIIALAVYLRLKKQPISLDLFVPVLLESSIYALTMGSLIVFLMVDILHINPQLSAATDLTKASPIAKVVLSIGAGVHEELFFRLLLMGGGTWFFERILNLRRFLAILFALLISAVAFTLAHHFGPLGESFHMGVVVYRLFAGIFFGLLFQFRGFSIAVYTHTLYDIYVLLLS